ALRAEQKRWIGERDKCGADRACIEKACRTRMAAITSSGEMTNRRAQTICGTVMKAVNDGSIASRFSTFAAPKQEEAESWKKAHPDSFVDLDGLLTIARGGKSRKIGVLAG